MKIGLDELEALLDVADAKSISRAARNAKVPTSTLSRAISRLEERLGAPLLRRMGRGELLTEAGRRLVEQSRDHVRSLRGIADGFALHDDEPHGRLRITAPTDFGWLFLASDLAAMAQKYPRLQIEADYTMRVVDIIGEDYDAAIRVTGQSFARSALVAHRISTFHAFMFASPAYLQSAPPLRRPADLQKHRVLGLLRGPTGPFVMQDSTERVKLEASSNLWMNDSLAIREAAINGAGLATLPMYIAREAVEAGRLVRVLPQLRGNGVSVYFVHPPVRTVSKQVRLLREMLTPRIRSLLAQ